MRPYRLKLFLKILPVFVPKSWLFAAIIAVIAIAFGSIYAKLGYLVLNAAIFIVTIGLAIVVHEFGHWLGARLVGEYPRRIELGKGHVVLQTTFFKSKLTIKNQLKTGLVLTVFSNDKYYRSRRIIYVVMGPLANLLLAGLYFSIFPLNYGFDSSVCAAYIGGLFNVLVFLGNLMPFKTAAEGGVRYASDGLQVWRLIFNKNIQSDGDDQLINDFLDGYDALQESDYGKALELLDSCLVRIEDQASIVRYACMVNIGICRGRLGDIDQFYNHMKEVETVLDDEKMKQLIGPVCNNIAYIHLLKGELDQAEQYIKKAMPYAVGVPEIVMMRGAIAISKGDFDRGISLLEDQIDMRFPTAQNAFSAMYLALAYGRKGDKKLKSKYWSFAMEHESLLTLDVRPVYQQIQQELLNPIEIF